MPIHCTVNSETRFFETICTGLVGSDEVHQMLDILVASNALGYRKLFDASEADTRMNTMDLLQIGVRMRSLHSAAVALGPLAIVIPDDRHMLLSRVIGILATPRRPIRVFSKTAQARKWLETSAVRDSMPAPSNT